MSHVATTLGSFLNKVHYYSMLIAKEVTLKRFKLENKRMALSAGIEPAT